MPVEYLMDDINLSVVIRPDESNLIWTDAFFSCDALSMDNCLIENGNLSSGWKNGFVSMHWQCSSTDWSMSHMAYFSGFSSRITIDAIDLSLVLPSSFSTVGYNGKIWSGNLFAGLDLEFHNARIQTPLAEGLDNAAYVVDSPEQGAAETRLSSGYKLPVGQHITADICADVNFYCMSGEKRFKRKVSLEDSF